MKKLIFLAAACFLLSGCFGTETMTKPVERLTLSTPKPAPLKLRSVVWKVQTIDNITYYSVDTNNFANLAKNTEDVQNRVVLQNAIIDKYQQFYEPVLTPVK